MENELKNGEFGKVGDTIEQSKSNLRRLTIVVAFCALVPLVGVLIFFGIPMIEAIRNSGFELSQEWLSENPGVVLLAVFAFMFICSILFLAFVFYLQWNQTKKFLNQYWESARVLGIRLESKFAAVMKVLPYGNKQIQVSSPSGIGKVNWKGKEIEVFHNFELQRTPNVVVGGMFSNRHAGAVTMMELVLDKGKAAGSGMFLVKTKLIEGILASMKWRGQVEVELDYGLSAVVHGIEEKVDLETLKVEVLKVFGKELMRDFIKLEGENSLMYCNGVFILNHQGFANLEEIRGMLDFLAKI